MRCSKLVRVYFSPGPQLCFSTLYVPGKEQLAIQAATGQQRSFDIVSINLNLKYPVLSLLISECYSGSSVGPLLHDC